MSTRLSLFCNRILEAGWLVALVVIPLHFNPFSSRVFEPDKIALLRSIAVIMALAWMIKGAETLFARLSLRRQEAGLVSEPHRVGLGRKLVLHPIVLLVLLFLASYGGAAGLSILPRVSLWGTYERLHGLVSVAAYLVFFFSILALLRTRAQQQRLITTVLLASIAMALYGILQHFGLDPLTWDRPVALRVHANMGNPVFLAAALSMAVPLTLYRLAETARKRRYVLFGCYLLVLAVQLGCLVFTQSRGPVLGLMVGLFFGGLLWLLIQHRWRAARIIIGCSIAVGALLTIINLPNAPLAVAQDVPYLSRLIRIADVEGSSEGRVLIWEGAVDLITADPKRMIVGYGPETIRLAYYPYYAAELGRSHGWDVSVDRMHNETFDVLVTTGGGGFFIYFLLFTSIVYYGLRWTGLIRSSRQQKVFLALWVLGGVGAVLGLRGAGQTWAFSGVALPFGVLGGLFLYLAGYAFFASLRGDPAEGTPSPRGYVVLIILLLSGLLAHFVETNVGIAVSATRLLFWVYTALFVVLGVFFRRYPDRATHAPTSPRAAGGSLPVMSQGVGIMLLSIAYSLSTPGMSSENMVRIGGLLAATWLVGGLLLVLSAQPTDGKPYFLRKLGIYTGLSLGPLVLLLSFKAGGVEGMPHHLVLYYVIVLLFIVTAALLMRPATRLPARKASLPGIVLASAGFLAAGLFITSTNVQRIQANMYHREALTAFQQRRYDQALVAYHRALDLDPRQEAYQLELAQLIAAKARYQTVIPAERDPLFREAETILRQAAADNPFEQNYPAALAEVYRLWAGKTADAQRRAARYEQAFTAFGAATRINKENVLVLKKWAETYQEQGDRVRALDTYRQVVAWDSTNAALYVQIGQLYRAEQQWALAAAMYEGALRHVNRPRPEIHQELALLYRRLGRLEEAVRESKQAVALDPTVPAHHRVLVDLYERLGRCSEALEVARAALRRWPNNNPLKARVDLLTQQCMER